MNSDSRRVWEFAAYGTSTNTKDNGYICNEDGSVTVYSENGKGKLVSESTDGIAFYYTKVPANKNFTLMAKVAVDSWTLSNGQDGFGIMAADRVGIHGDPIAFWNNYYSAVVTRVGYRWDGEKVSDVGEKIIMKLGIGAQEKTGVTPENLSRLEAGDTAAVTEEFYNTMTPLETSAAVYGEGTYNIIGNATKEVEGTVENPITEMIFKIQKNNTGYFVSYIDGEGKETVSKYYDTEALSQLDKDHIYVGFFASRNARVTFSDIQLSVVSPDEDEPAEERPVVYVTPVYTVESSMLANSSEYEFVYYGNADGKLVMKEQSNLEPGCQSELEAVCRIEKEAVCRSGQVLAEERVTANTRFRKKIKLEKGINHFRAIFTPDEQFSPAAYQRLSSYETVEFDFNVEYRVSEKSVIYISPDGCPENDGSKEAPVDIYTAIACPTPGQKLYLMEGTYHLDKPVVIDRGINGAADKRIYLMADPEAKSRPILDFGKKCAGVMAAADYWHLQGFEVTRSGSCLKGLVIAGNHNVLERVYAYRNGNTGIQISRYKDNDTREDWPSNNLVLNCTSYLNADPGYEDADGFAAKITVGEGNVFDGCISAYNADDGWDFFAKLESGPIGKVIIRNSVAFKNGYDLDEEGNEIIAGNGNGFKMGGSSLSGHHELENCISFANREIGIDCNTCPDITVRDAISFNNEGHNVGFYTSEAQNTDFTADGIVSFKDGKLKNIDDEIVGEMIAVKGSQDISQIIKDNNYYFDGRISTNKSGTAAVGADWFVSLDTDTAIKDRIRGITRNEDGSINMNGYLELTDKAVTGVGARLG